MNDDDSDSLFDLIELNYSQKVSKIYLGSNNQFN